MNGDCTIGWRTLRRQRGIVLVVAMVLLAAMSLLAASTLRNAISTESVSGAVRTSETALQAAEIALRYCERLALASAAAMGASTATPSALTAPLWQDLANWDGASPKRTVLPLDAVNASGAYRLYRRAPECLAEPLVVASEDEVAGSPVSTAMSATVFVITARGFGADVAAPVAPGRPAGTEVWLQSQIEQIHTAGPPRPPTRAWRQLFMR